MKAATVRRFFEPELSRSPWFWITGTAQAGVSVLGLITLAQHWKRAEVASDAFLLLGTALTVLIWLQCVGEFRRIRRLPVDWEKVELGGPLLCLLESSIRLIQAGTVLPSLIAAALMSGLSP